MISSRPWGERGRREAALDFRAAFFAFAEDVFTMLNSLTRVEFEANDRRRISCGTSPRALSSYQL
jgi:hypothetical protein